ncbi:MAG: hypothetical protein ACOZCO_09160 [Bacteroidota bacterium]
MSKTNITRFIILLLMAYPFWIAYLKPTGNNIVNVLCMIIVIAGAIACVSIGEDKKPSAH